MAILYSILVWKILWTEEPGRLLSISSVQFSCSVLSDSFQPHGLQHARLPCPSIYPSLLKFMSIELVMLSTHLIFCHPLLLQPSFPASGSFLMHQLLVSGGQSIRASASASVLPMTLQGGDFFKDGLVGSPCTPRGSQESSPTPIITWTTWLMGGILQLRNMEFCSFLDTFLGHLSPFDLSFGNPLFKKLL